MKPTYVFVQLKGPSRNNPGGVITDGFFIIEGNTLHLVDVNGEVEKDVDGTTFSRKLTEEHPNVIAGRLIRERDARRKKSLSGFDGPIIYPPTKRA